MVSVQHPVTPTGSCSLRVPEARGTKENQLKGHGSACHQPLRAPHYTEAINGGGGAGCWAPPAAGISCRTGAGGGDLGEWPWGRRMSVSSKTDKLDVP